MLAKHLGIIEKFSKNIIFSDIHYTKRIFSPCLCKKFCTSDKEKNDLVPGPMSAKYEEFSEQSSPIIFDVDEERQKIEEERKLEHDSEFEGINFKRGVNGVFEIEELVEILRKEKAKDLLVVKIAPDRCYGDYMVIVTGNSSTHMFAICEFIRKIYKKKMISSDHIPKMEGKGCKKWMALDLGNIILHVFSKSARKEFDLDSLWVLGKEYDSHLQRKLPSDDIALNYSQLLANFIPNQSPTDSSVTEANKI